MIDQPSVLIEVRDGVATVTLNRPEKRNAFDPKMIGELTIAFERLEQDPSVQVAVLQGSGKAFSAGADINYMQDMVKYSLDENIADAMKLARMFRALHDFSKPLIGFVHGAALGGGAGLVALCDYVLADKDTKLGFTEILLGLRPSTISPYVMERIGTENALNYFSSGKMFMAEEARRIGLVDEETAPETAAMRLADAVHIAQSSGKDALRGMRPGTQENVAWDGTHDAGVVALVKGVEARRGGAADALMEFTARDIAEARVSDVGQQKTRAYIEKQMHTVTR